MFRYLSCSYRSPDRLFIGFCKILVDYWIGFHMKYQFLSDSDFNEVIHAQTGLVLVVFVADWSGSCYMIDPFFGSLSRRFANRVTIFKSNFDVNENLVIEFSVQDVPTTLLFRNGELIDRIEGIFSKKELNARVQRYL